MLDIVKKYAKYILLFVVAILIWILYGMLVKKKDHQPPDPKIWKSVEKAHEEALIARIEAKTKSDLQKKQLDKIAKLEDGKSRRTELAKLLKEL